MANWVCRDFSSVYEPIKRLSGAAYFLLESGFLQNPLYSSVPPIRYLKPRDLPEFGLFSGEKMYELVHDIEKLRFLTAPQDFRYSLEKVL